MVSVSFKGVILQTMMSSSSRFLNVCKIWNICWIVADMLDSLRMRRQGKSFECGIISRWQNWFPWISRVCNLGHCFKISIGERTRGRPANPSSSSRVCPLANETYLRIVLSFGPLSFSPRTILCQAAGKLQMELCQSLHTRSITLTRSVKVDQHCCIDGVLQYVRKWNEIQYALHHFLWKNIPRVSFNGSYFQTGSELGLLSL